MTLLIFLTWYASVCFSHYAGFIIGKNNPKLNWIESIVNEGKK